MSATDLIQLNSEVQVALTANQPVVALESTVIAHGLPRPQNLETAVRLEEIVRAEDSIAATIAVIEGKLCVGLDGEQRELIANENDIKKVSTRDLPIAVARRWNGATTVASTMWIAHRAGHPSVRDWRHWRRPSWIAAGRVRGSAGAGAHSQMIVVCSGAKIVLDLPATREWLETNSVTVVGYGCDEMPAFYSRRSGLPVDVRCDSPEEVVEIFKAQRELGMESALLVTVPVPTEAEVDSDLLQRVLDDSLAEAARQPITGRISRHFCSRAWPSKVRARPCART